MKKKQKIKSKTTAPQFLTGSRHLNIQNLVTRKKEAVQMFKLFFPRSLAETLRTNAD
jgi:hypothetical protein